MQIASRAVLLVLCVTGALAEEPMRLLAGSKGGTYHRVATQLAERWSAEGHACVALDTPGSLQNLIMLGLGQGQIGIAQSDCFGRLGDHPRLRRVLDDVRLLVPLYSEELHVLVRRDSGVATPLDLRARSISLGPPDSGTMITARAMLELHGLDPVRDVSASYLANDEALGRLLDGSLDAMCFVGGAPLPLLALLSDQDAARVQLVSLVPEAIERAVGRGYYTRAVLPAGTYLWQHDPVTTVATQATLVARADVPPELVAKLLASLFEGAAELSAQHPKWREVDPDGALALLERAPLPLHDGARQALVAWQRRAALDGRIDFSLLTGPADGTYDRLGSALARAVGGLRVSPIKGRGSLQNAIALAMGAADTALLQGDLVALLAARSDLSPLVADLRVIAPLYFEELHLVVRRELALRTPAELAGRRVSLGEAGSGSSLSAMALIQSLGLAGKIDARFLSQAVALQSLRDGTLDAAILVAGQPLPALAELPADAAAGLDILSLPEPVAPYRRAPIHAASYPWLGREVASWSTPCLLVARRGVSPLLVAGLLAAIHAEPGRSALIAAHPKAGESTRALELELALGGVWRLHAAALGELAKDLEPRLAPLRAALSGNDEGARIAAVEGLAHPALAPLAARELVAALAGSSELARTAARALELAGEVAEEPLVALLTAADPTARMRAAVALGTLGTRTCAGPLARAAREDADPGVRAAAAIAMALREAARD